MTTHVLIERETTDHVIGAFFEVYNHLEYGFLERIYADALKIELQARSRTVQREVLIPIWYKGKQISPQNCFWISGNSCESVETCCSGSCCIRGDS